MVVDWVGYLRVSCEYLSEDGLRFEQGIRWRLSKELGR